MSDLTVVQKMQQIHTMTRHVVQVFTKKTCIVDTISYSLLSEDACSIPVYIQLKQEYEIGTHRAELEELLLSASSCGIDGMLADIHFCHAVPNGTTCIYLAMSEP